jgi:hypothetical protein
MPATLEQLRTRVRVRSNVVNNRVVLDEQVNEFINEAAKMLWRKMLTSDESLASLQAEFTLDATPAGARVATPAGFWRAQGLDIYPDADNVEEVFTFNFADRNKSGYRGYRIQGDELIVQPFRNAAGPYRIYYVPDYTPLVDDSDELPAMLDRHDEYIVVAAAIDVKDVREMDTSALLTRLGMLEQEIPTVAANRQSEPATAPVLERYSGMPGDDPARGPRG